jgi:hypothetical protein
VRFRHRPTKGVTRGDRLNGEVGRANEGVHGQGRQAGTDTGGRTKGVVVVAIGSQLYPRLETAVLACR